MHSGIRCATVSPMIFCGGGVAENLSEAKSIQTRLKAQRASRRKQTPTIFL